MKNKTIWALMSLMMIFSANAWAGDLDWSYKADNRTWFVVEKTQNRLVAVGIHPQESPHSNRSAIIVNYHPETVGHGEKNFDYTLNWVNVYCETKGRTILYDERGYVLGRGAVWEKKHTPDISEMSWATDTEEFWTNHSDPNTIEYKTWKTICQAGGRVALPGQSHDEVVRAYRKELSERKQEEQVQSDQKYQAGMAAATKSNVTPQTDLAWARGGDGHHWHYALAATNIFLVVDVHRVTPGHKPHLKKMARVSFFPESREIGGGLGEVDYIVEQVIADCNTEGAMKSLASAFYITKNKSGTLAVAAKSKDANGDATSVQELDKYTWDWVCKGDQKINAISSNISFDQMRQMYLDSFKAKP